MNLGDALDYYFYGGLWEQHLDQRRNKPDRLFDGLKQSLGPLDQFDLVHPVESVDLSFLLLRGDEAVLIEFEPPGTTSVAYLGVPAGGTYTETVEYVDGQPQISGVFTHKRVLPYGLHLRFETPGQEPPGRNEAAEASKASARETPDMDYCAAL